MVLWCWLAGLLTHPPNPLNSPKQPAFYYFLRIYILVSCKPQMMTLVGDRKYYLFFTKISSSYFHKLARPVDTFRTFYSMAKRAYESNTLEKLRDFLAIEPPEFQLETIRRRDFLRPSLSRGDFFMYCRLLL